MITGNKLKVNKVFNWLSDSYEIRISFCYYKYKKKKTKILIELLKIQREKISEDLD